MHRPPPSKPLERDRNDAQRKQQAAEADSDRNREAAASSDAQLQQALRERGELRAVSSSSST